jgi:cytochrome c554/c'-like protein
VFQKAYPATPLLFVDAGDFTGEPTFPGRMQTDALIEGMNALGYKVVNLSRRELAHGYAELLERKKKAGFEFVSANIVWQDTAEPVVAPTHVCKVTLRDGAKAREVRIGFIGLTQNDPAFLKEDPRGRRIVTADPLAAAEKHVPILKRKADVVVALVAMDLDKARQVPKRAGDIDLVLGAQGAMQTRTDDFPEDTQIGKTRLLYIGDQGKNLGEVRLTFDAQKAIVSSRRSVIGLTREWPDEPALARLMETTKVAVNEYNRKQAEAAIPFAAPPAAPAAPSQPTYTGSERCVTCHETEYAVWARSGHAHAFRTLEEAKQDFNPECVGCHAIGFGKAHGFVNHQATPQLVNVGCESCHGPSSRHPEQVAQDYGRTDTAFCLTCHTRENSPDYDPAAYIPKVRHWAEKQAAR